MRAAERAAVFECRLLALFGHGAMSDFSPLSAQERTWGTDLAERVPAPVWGVPGLPESAGCGRCFSRTTAHCARRSRWTNPPGRVDETGKGVWGTCLVLANMLPTTMDMPRD